MEKYDILDAYWHDIHEIPLLTEEEERNLAEQIKSGNERALDKLVTSNLRFVVSIARQYSEKNAEVSIDDLISEGNIAMMVAARKWNPDLEPRFVNYALHDIKKAMQEACQEQSGMMTLPKRDAGAGKDIRRMSTDAPVHPGQTNTLGDMLKAGKPMTDDDAEDNEVSYSLTVALRYLNNREKKIIKSFYGIGTEDHQTMAEIGEEMNLKRERVRQIRKTAERKMRKIMKQKVLTFIIALMTVLTVTAQPNGGGRPPMGEGGQPPMIGTTNGMHKDKKGKKDGKEAKSTKKRKVRYATDIVDAHELYVFGLAFSPIDSVVYVTTKQNVADAQIHLRSRFLVARNELSTQLRNHMAMEGEKKLTCCVIYDQNEKKLNKKYQKQLARYKKQGYLIKNVDENLFSFKAVRVETDEDGLHYEEIEVDDIVD